MAIRQPCGAGSASRRKATALGALALVVLAGILVGVASPASAIVGGTADSVHTFVGAWIIQLQDGSMFWCSGDLLSSRVFLSAGHCGALASLIGVTPAHMWITFDTDIFPSGGYPLCSLPCTVPGFTPPAPDWLPVSSFVVNPLFDLHVLSNAGAPTNDTHDQTAVILAQPVIGIPFATLAPSGLLDQLRTSRVLPTMTITKVGYGFDLVNGNGVVSAERRMTSAPSFQALLPAYLVTNGGTIPGVGFTSLGDSGGPSLLMVNGVAYVVAINLYVLGGGRFSQFTLGFSGRTETAAGQSFIVAEIAANPGGAGR